MASTFCLISAAAGDVIEHLLAVHMPWVKCWTVSLVGLQS